MLEEEIEKRFYRKLPSVIPKIKPGDLFTYNGSNNGHMAFQYGYTSIHKGYIVTSTSTVEEYVKIYTNILKRKPLMFIRWFPIQKHWHDIYFSEMPLPKVKINSKTFFLLKSHEMIGLEFLCDNKKYVVASGPHAWHTKNKCFTFTTLGKKFIRHWVPFPRN